MRVEGWESLLEKHIREAYRNPFAWGSRDCALWATEWVLKATGNDFGGPWRGKYTTGNGAAKRMKKLGFASVEAIADSNMVACPIAMAGRGDIVLHPEGMLGVCAGRASFFLTETSVTSMPTLACSSAWKVE